MKRMSAELCRRSRPTGGLNLPTVTHGAGIEARRDVRVDDDGAAAGEVRHEAEVVDAAEGAFEGRAHAAQDEGVRGFRHRVAAEDAIVGVQRAAQADEVRVVGGADLEARGIGRDARRAGRGGRGRFSCWISSLRSSTAGAASDLRFRVAAPSLLAGAGAFCASATPAKGSSAAMDARNAARLIFTLVLLDSCVPQGQESVGMWGLCRQSRPGDGAVTPQVDLVIAI